MVLTKRSCDLGYAALPQAVTIIDYLLVPSYQKVYLSNDTG